MATIKIRKAEGTWVVRAYGAVIGESSNALSLEEGDYPEVIYFPRADIAMEFLDRSATASHCPKKGDATYFGVSSPEGTMADAAWSYENPTDQATKIAGHIAFYTDKVTVEQL